MPSSDASAVEKKTRWDLATAPEKCGDRRSNEEAFENEEETVYVSHDPGPLEAPGCCWNVVEPPEKNYGFSEMICFLNREDKGRRSNAFMLLATTRL